MIPLPDAFVQRMKKQLGQESELFFQALSSPPVTSIRLHHQKGKLPFPHASKVPWCDTGYYLQDRPLFSQDPHWHGGAYYVQEASSMVLDYVITQLSLEQKPRIWMDMCAAPGGKTGILAKHLGPEDVLLANEVIGSRRSILYENLIKAGFINTFISGEPATAFTDPFADIILVDAPCAGEGMMRKDAEALNQWSQSLVESCALMQKQITEGAFRALQQDGYLIYSTCSYSPEENMLNVAGFQNQYNLESIPISFPESWGITALRDGESTGYQLYPHKLRGEGLFIAALKHTGGDTSGNRKSGKQKPFFEPIPKWLGAHLASPEEFMVRKNDDHNELIRKAAMPKATELLERIPRAKAVVTAGALKGKDFVPAHVLATSGVFSGNFPAIELPFETALDYLEREITSLPEGQEKGWYVMAFEETYLGWAKWTGQGWKNHYPMSWRLRNRIRS